MEYRFLNPQFRESEVVPHGLSRYYEDRLREMDRSGIYIDCTVYQKAKSFRLIEIPEGSRLWKQSLQPFLEMELDKKLAGQGKTRQQWEEERERALARMQAWWDSKERLQACFDEADKIAREKEEAEARKRQELDRYFRQKYGFIGYRRLVIRRFRGDVHDTLKRVWQRKVHIHTPVWKPRYLCSPRWMKFWIFLQEKVLHPIRWKYSLEYQLHVFTQASESLGIALYMFKYSPDRLPEAEAMQAMWDEILGKVEKACERGNHRLSERYCDHSEDFGKALAVLRQWQEVHQEAEELKAQEEAGKRLVAAVEALGGQTTNGALGGVQ
jgi:hypothetical protein